MIVNENVAAQIGQAWRSHLDGRNDAAVSEFERILKNAPDSIDANYGLGLTQHALGKHDAAANSFRRALDLAGKVEPSDQEERDRYMMLTRMIKQRLAETNPAASAQ